MVHLGRLAAKTTNAMQLQGLMGLIGDLRSMAFVTNDTQYLDEAEQAARWGARISAADPSDIHPARLFELAETLDDKARRTGNLDDLREAAWCAAEAVNRSRNVGEAHIRSVTANSLAERLARTERAAGAHRNSTPPPRPSSDTRPVRLGTHPAQVCRPPCRRPAC